MSQPLFGGADDSIVVAVNSCHTQFMDNAVLAITDIWFFVGIVCCIFAYAFYRQKPQMALLFCGLLIVAVGCSDFLCASIIRPAVQQLRPTNPDNPISAMLHIVGGHRGGRYGFPSCHAANSFAIAIFSSLWFRKRWLAEVLMGWASLECYTRLYMGVHYPSDVVFGAAIGSLTAYLIYLLSKEIQRKVSNQHKK